LLPQLLALVRAEVVQFGIALVCVLDCNRHNRWLNLALIAKRFSEYFFHIGNIEKFGSLNPHHNIQNPLALMLHPPNLRLAYVLSFAKIEALVAFMGEFEKKTLG
jgi:hypothetical protein